MGQGKERAKFESDSRVYPAQTKDVVFFLSLSLSLPFVPLSSSNRYLLRSEEDRPSFLFSTHIDRAPVTIWATPSSSAFFFGRSLFPASLFSPLSRYLLRAECHSQKAMIINIIGANIWEVHKEAMARKETNWQCFWGRTSETFFFSAVWDEICRLRCADSANLSFHFAASPPPCGYGPSYSKSWHVSSTEFHSLFGRVHPSLSRSLLHVTEERKENEKRAQNTREKTFSQSDMLTCSLPVKGWRERLFVLFLPVRFPFPPSPPSRLLSPRDMPF